MKISIFGVGYVGVVSGACLAQMGHEVVAVDVNPQKVDLINAGRSPIVEEGIVDLVRHSVESGRLRATTEADDGVKSSTVSIVSVGTPSARNGSLSTEAACKVTTEIGRSLANSNAQHTVVYRSTTLPGTTEDMLIPLLSKASGREVGNGLQVCFNPEFLREGSSIKDFTKPPFTIVGSACEAGFAALQEIYAGIDAPFFRTSIRQAESVKYLSNLYHALKITFANEVGAVLKSLDLDAREAMEIFCHDRELNISSAYLRPGFAFGGSCLPKDLRAFLFLAKSRDLDVPMLRHVLASNEEHIDRAFRMVTGHGRRKVAILGLSFKPGTDDLRESPLVTLAERLIGKGYDLSIYDPLVQTATLMGANREFIDREIPHIERLMTADLRSALQDVEVCVIGHLQKADIDQLMTQPPTVPVVDLQGIKALQNLEGLSYQGICW